MSDSPLKYINGTTELKPFLDHTEFRLKYPITAISEQAWIETQKYNFNTAYGHTYIGCLVAGNIAMEEIQKLKKIIAIQEERIKNLQKSNDLYRNPMTFFSDREGAGEFGYICEEDREDLQIQITELGDTEAYFYDEVGGKLARETYEKDIRLQKRLEKIR